DRYFPRSGFLLLFGRCEFEESRAALPIGAVSDAVERYPSDPTGDVGKVGYCLAIGVADKTNGKAGNCSFRVGIGVGVCGIAVSTEHSVVIYPPDIPTASR